MTDMTDTDYDVDEDDDGWWRMVSQDELAAMSDAIAVDNFTTIITTAMAKTNRAVMPTPQLDDNDAPRRPKPDASQGQSRPLSDPSPAEDLSIAMAQALGRVH